MGRVGGVSGVLNMSQMGEVEHEDTKTRIKRKQEEIKRKKKGGIGGVEVLVALAGVLVLLFLVLGGVLGLEINGVLKTTVRPK